jgi:16S rRNA processing protein RimM
MVVVGRIARPHGLRGQVVVNPETDFAEARFKIGAEVWADRPGGCERLIVRTARFQKGRPIVAFEGTSTIEEAQQLVGRELRVPEEELEPLDRGTYYNHQLVGCVVETLGGATVGTVTGVEGRPGSSVLVVDGRRGEVLIPLALEICVEIDVGARRVRIRPLDGLLELNETGPKRRRSRH